MTIIFGVFLHLVVVDGMVNQQRYVNILCQKLILWAKAVFLRGTLCLRMTMQRPTLHEAHAVLLKGEEVEVMESSAQSPPKSISGTRWCCSSETVLPQ